MLLDVVFTLTAGVVAITGGRLAAWGDRLEAALKAGREKQRRVRRPCRRPSGGYKPSQARPRRQGRLHAAVPVAAP